jgi:hypothetical protein
VIHDRDTLAELVRLLHVVRRQDDRAAARVVLADDLPQEQPRLGIEPRGRLVEEQHLGVVHHRPGDREPLHHPAGESAGELVGPIRELEACEETLRALVALGRGHPEVGAVKSQDLAGSQRKVEILPLGTTPMSGLTATGFPERHGRPPTRGLPWDGCAS